MSRGKGKDNSDKVAGFKSLYLVKVNANKTADVTRLPIGSENEDGETYFLVRDHAVKALTSEAYDGESRLIRALVAQNIRAQLKETPEFETVTVNVDVDKMDRDKEPKKEDVVDADADETEEEVEVVPAPAYQASY